MPHQPEKYLIVDGQFIKIGEVFRASERNHQSSMVRSENSRKSYKFSLPRKITGCDDRVGEICMVVHLPSGIIDRQWS
jgi:hypothetical protein